jgi:hypothetical protein
MARITVVIHAAQLAQLDEEAGALGVSRSEVLRRRLNDSEPLPVPEPITPTRESTLMKLEQAAAGGSVVAMATLARELRLGGALQAVKPKRGRVTVADLTADELGLRLVR